MPIIASFDIGIKNLALCISEFDTSGSLVQVHRWVNLTLLAGGGESQAATRCACGGPAAWRSSARLYCRKCAKSKTDPPPHPCFQLVTKPGAKATVADWRTWATGPPLSLDAKEARKLTKTAIEERAAAVLLMPYTPPKSKGMTPNDVLVAMERCLSGELSHLANADLIRVENQPCDRNPTMKTVQIILFTLLNHRLASEFPDTWRGKVVFANASQKTRGAGIAPGNATKRARKTAGIERVEAALTAAAATTIAETWRTWFRAQAKRDDLGDAFIMCLDEAGFRSGLGS